MWKDTRDRSSHPAAPQSNGALHPFFMRKVVGKQRNEEGRDKEERKRISPC